LTDEEFSIKSRGLWLRKATRREKGLEHWCDALREEVNVPSVAIMVEGRKDVKALAQLQIRAISVGKNIEETLKRMFKEGIKIVILLPDTDRAGEDFLKKWKGALQQAGLGTIERYWKILRSLRISHVEGIPAHIRRAAKKYGNN
jgi:5S rRNA maturation endonuclease (ribonuclease M5)